MASKINFAINVPIISRLARVIISRLELRSDNSKLMNLAPTTDDRKTAGIYYADSLNSLKRDGRIRFVSFVGCVGRFDSQAYPVDADNHSIYVAWVDYRTIRFGAYHQ